MGDGSLSQEEIDALLQQGDEPAPPPPAAPGPASPSASGFANSNESSLTMLELPVQLAVDAAHVQWKDRESVLRSQLSELEGRSCSLSVGGQPVGRFIVGERGTHLIDAETGRRRGRGLRVRTSQDRIRGFLVPIVVVIDAMRIPSGLKNDFRPGTRLVFPRLAESVLVYAGSSPVACGEIVIVDERYGVRITELMPNGARVPAPDMADPSKASGPPITCRFVLGTTEISAVDVFAFAPGSLIQLDQSIRQFPWIELGSGERYAARLTVHEDHFAAALTWASFYPSARAYLASLAGTAREVSSSLGADAAVHDFQDDVQWIRQLSPGVLAQSLDGESPETIAALLSLLPEQAAAETIESIQSRAVRIGAAIAIYRQGSLSGAELARAVAAWRRILEGLTKQKRLSGSQDFAIGVMQHLRQESAREVLDALEGDDRPAEAAAMRARIFLFEDICFLSESDLAVVWRSTTDEDLSNIFFNAPRGLRERLKRGVEQHRLGMLAEPGPAYTPRRSIERSRETVKNLVVQLMEAGRISYRPGDQDELFLSEM